MSTIFAGNGPFPKGNAIRRAWRSLLDHMVQSVPPEYAACEFNCRAPQCGSDHWECCENRLRASIGLEGRPNHRRSGDPPSTALSAWTR